MLERLVERANELATAMLDGDAAAARHELAALRPALEAALASTAGPAPRPLSPGAAAAIGEALAIAADGQPAAVVETILARALPLAEPDARARARLLAVRARTRYLFGHFAEGAADAERALAALASIDVAREDPLALRVLLVGSVTDRDTGRLDRALERSEEARAIATGCGDGHNAAWAELHAASARLMLGDAATAEAGYERARATARRLGMQRVEALAEVNLALCAQRRGALDVAEARYRAARDRFERLGDPLLCLKLDTTLARLVLERGETAKASDIAASLGETARALDDRDTAVRTAYLIGRAHLEEARALALKNGFQSVLPMLAGEPQFGDVPALRVAADAAWFAPPGGERVDLRTRVPVRRVLAHLVQRRLADAPEAPASTEELVAAGWPGERILPEAARDRVYAAIGTLRKLGLDRVLVRTDGGYAIASEVRVVVD